MPVAVKLAHPAAKDMGLAAVPGIRHATKSISAFGLASKFMPNVPACVMEIATHVLLSSFKEVLQSLGMLSSYAPTPAVGAGIGLPQHKGTAAKQSLPGVGGGGFVTQTLKFEVVEAVLENV